MINLITPPDVLHNENTNVLFINLSLNHRKEINETLQEFDNLNVYIFDNDQDLNWLIGIVSSCDFILIDVDNCHLDIKTLVGYILSKNQTFYLTSDTIMPYNMINPNKVISLDMFFNRLRGINEKQK